MVKWPIVANLTEVYVGTELINVFVSDSKIYVKFIGNLELFFRKNSPLEAKGIRKWTANILLLTSQSHAEYNSG